MQDLLASIKKSIEKYGILETKEIVHNPSYEELFEAELDSSHEGFEKGQLTELDAVNVLTGRFTGRSPKDKYIINDDITKDSIWWTSEESPNDNKPLSVEAWNDLEETVAKQLNNKKLYVIDCYSGANESTRIKVRFIMEVAWQAHFVKNMFIRPTKEELKTYGEPDFVVLNASKTVNPKWEEHGMNSEVFTVFNLSKKMQLIGGSWYGGEMKKGMFAMMNYYLPLQKIAAMHCSANRGKDGDVAIFFGLSGTGKTTLSTDPNRSLIGDDEHGWDDEGIFNFEGGCYAKTIDLDKDSEPEIYQAIRRDALLENVVVDANGKIDFTDGSLTQNTRVSYPIYHIDNIVKPISKAGHATKVIFLTADAFGVLPPVSKLTKDQTKYHFLSGFTAKLAGTELGVTTPQPTFSACFGEAFLSLHPTKYAEELIRKMDMNDAKAYLVNTGWNGSGKRISIKDTRGIIDAILNGDIEKAETKVMPIFNLEIPTALPGVDTSVLDTRDTYSDAKEWDDKATNLASLYIKNFKKFTDNEEGAGLVAAGPQL